MKNLGEGNELALGLEPSKDLLNGDLVIKDVERPANRS